MTVTPCREKNAIRNVAFAVHFQHSFSEIDLDEIKKLHRGKKDEFPRLEGKRAVSIQFDPASKVQKAGRDEFWEWANKFFRIKKKDQHCDGCKEPKTIAL